MLRKIITSGVLAFSLGFAPVATAQSQDDGLYEQLDLLMRVMEQVRTQYVDEVDDREIIEAAIQGMLKSLDPHSNYLNPETFQQMRVQMEGEYGGLGLEVQMDNGLVKVVSPIDDTPADRAGMEGGDLISHIDGNAVKGKTLSEAVETMRGTVGEPIVLTVIREGNAGPFEITIVRDKIKVRSVVHRVEENTIGYVRITTFNMQTGDGLEKAINKLKDELGNNMDGLILDLRNNPGGLLGEAVRVSDTFLDRGEIVSTRGRRRSNNNRWYATAGDMLEGLPIVVLTNAYSASASEIVAGALKDHRRAVIVGDRSFGKGTVQSEIRLGNGSQAVRLTTARYYTPSGQSIQGRGIEPDIEVLTLRGKLRQSRREADLLNTIQNDQDATKRPGEFIPLTDEQRAEMNKPLTEEQIKQIKEEGDVQLKYAVDLLKKMAAKRQPVIAQAQQIKEG